METSTISILDQVVGFIFDWTTYFCAIPIWFVGGVIVMKMKNGRVVVGDLAKWAIVSLVNPIWHCFALFLIIAIPMALPMIPIILLILNWKEIKDKKVF